jgi:hypothetical protein
VRLGFAHEAGLLLAAFTALSTVLLGGEFPSAFWLVLGAPPISMWLRLRGLCAPPSSGTLLGLASIAWGVSQVFVLGDRRVQYWPEG